MKRRAKLQSFVARGRQRQTRRSRFPGRPIRLAEDVMPYQLLVPHGRVGGRVVQPLIDERVASTTPAYTEIGKVVV